MAPTERFNLPLRWQFEPAKDERDGSVRWSWYAYTQSGEVSMQSKETFDTLTGCMEDAKANGYGR